MIKTKKFLMIIMSLAFFATNSIVSFSACASNQSAEYEWINKDYDDKVSTGEIIVLGKGSAAEKFKGRPNEELMAEESALADAKSRIVDIIIGSYIDSATNIKDKEAVEQEGKTSLQGKLKGVSIKKRYFDRDKRISYVLVRLQKEDVKKLFNKLNEKFNLNVSLDEKK